MGVIANIASIVTLALFVFYFVGRIWAIKVDSKYIGVTTDVEFLPDYGEPDISDIDLGGTDLLKMRFGNNIKSLKIESIEENQVAGHLEYIPRDKMITIRLTISEGIPTYRVVAECANGLVGSFEIAYDGKNNYSKDPTLKIQKTIKSWLYYILK